MRFPVVPTVDLHALRSFAVLCQSTNFLRKGAGGGRGYLELISFPAYPWNRILHPPGLGLPSEGLGLVINELIL